MTDASDPRVTDSGPRFMQISLAITRNPNISPTAKLVYGRLVLYAGKNGRCNPSHETIGAEVGLRDRQIRNVLAELKTCGLIDWTRTRASSSFTVRDEHSPEYREWQSIAGQTGTILPDKSGTILPIKRGSSKRGSSIDVDLDCPIPRNQAAVIPKPSPKRYPALSDALASYRNGGGSKRPPQSAYPSDAMVAEIMAAANGNSESWVIAQLVHLYNERGLYWGTTTGPRTWQWFVTVLADRADRAERLELARAPENTWDHDGTRLVQ